MSAATLGRPFRARLRVVTGYAPGSADAPRSSVVGHHRIPRALPHFSIPTSTDRPVGAMRRIGGVATAGDADEGVGVPRGLCAWARSWYEEESPAEAQRWNEEEEINSPACRRRARRRGGAEMEEIHSPACRRRARRHALRQAQGGRHEAGRRGSFPQRRRVFVYGSSPRLCASAGFFQRLPARSGQGCRAEARQNGKVILCSNLLTLLVLALPCASTCAEISPGESQAIPLEAQRIHLRVCPFDHLQPKPSASADFGSRSIFGEPPIHRSSRNVATLWHHLVACK